MSGSDTQDLVGTLVGAERRTYEGFTDKSTGEQRPGGVTYTLHIVTEFTGSPVEVKVPAGDAAAFGELASLGFGAQVALVVKLGVRGNRIDRRLVTAEVIKAAASAEANGGVAPAGTGATR